MCKDQPPFVSSHASMTVNFSTAPVEYCMQTKTLANYVLISLRSIKTPDFYTSMENPVYQYFVVLAQA